VVLDLCPASSKKETKKKVQDKVKMARSTNGESHTITTPNKYYSYT